MWRKKHFNCLSIATPSSGFRQYFLDGLTKAFSYVLCGCDQYRTYTVCLHVIWLGMNNGGFKREHEELYSSTIQGIISTAMSMATKLYRVVAYHEGLPSIKSHNPMVTKFGRMVTYLDGLLLIKSHDRLIRWSCKITWQTKIITSPLSQCSCSPNLVEWWLTLKGL